ncbi:HAMP domain-containing sensor histidine kinase [Fictibacillus sp. Mic-4]|uniref:sensor histidine kinase n=1 Tax=Fictibacillus TaxID=1329200 RepID=UPI000423A41D|nr:HAMP domain-containing sensor histidine kinase [Fictibacillus gelatini]
MLFVLIMLWTIGGILLLTANRSPTRVFLAFVAFCGGSGALSVVITKYILPLAAKKGIAPGTLTVVDNIGTAASLMQYYGLPYTFILFAIFYNPAFITRKIRNVLPFVLLCPILATLLFERPFYPINFKLALFWVAPYIAFGSYLILSKKEDNFFLRRNHQITSLAVVPAVILCSIMNYVLPNFGLEGMWRHNTWFVSFAVLICLIGMFKYGFLGIQFFIEKRELDYSIHAITSGTAILNHAIKNDVGKMRLFGKKIERFAMETGQEELLEDIRVILSTSEHVQDVIQHVRNQTRDLALKKERHDLAVILENLLAQFRPSLDRIKVHTLYDGNFDLYCDRTQVTEVFNNLLLNAIEAMPDGGELTVSLYKTNKHAVAEIKDSGVGIEKKYMKQVMKPFFTTKTKSESNFGLGLAYAYQVMKKHKGSINIQSEQGKGTTISLQFPL